MIQLVDVSNLPTSEIINSLLLGGFLGTIGQGIRAAMGIKKMKEVNTMPDVPNSDFNINRLIGTLLLGFVAGVLATLPFFKENFSVRPIWTQQVILTLIAAGYAGVDFIEGFLKTYLPEKPANLQTTTPAPITPSTPNQPTASSNNNMTIDPNQTVAG
jgi:hypothetical protein